MRRHVTRSPLSWVVRSGTGGLDGAPNTVDHDRAERIAAVRRWAETFDLHPDPNAVAGAVEYRGQIENVPVSVWAVVDDAAFYGTFDPAPGGAPDDEE
ncbi:hypothetical protein BKA01_003044 [Pseudonocardia eucalypti]|nr:hypothetical protein [Pseudonocardia eucalypti]